jgi:hypothetical protein
MKNVTLFIVVLISFASLPLWANEVSPYEWEKDRKRTALTEKENALPELIVKQHVQYQYVLENDQFLMYSTIHRIIYVNNNEAIQKHNRIVISMNSTLELVDLKARAINKDGKAIYFDRTNLKEIKDEETGSAVRIFAVEGIELGSEIEYYFTRKMNASLYDRVFMQFDVAVKAGTFMLSCPNHLKFDFKTYQNLAKVSEELGEEKNVYTTSAADVPGSKKEEFSQFDSNRKRIEFKLAYNTARSQARLYTWEEAAKNFYRVLTTNSKDDEKAVDKFVKTLGDNPKAKTADRIKNIETKIKKTIQINKESRGDALDQLESVIKQKVASREGITKLFLIVFDKLAIKCQPAITCSRENMKFDGEFDSWSYLDDYLLYFPDTKGFIAPYFFEVRYPIIPADLTAQQGLFLEPFQVGEVKSALASIQEIPATDYAINTDDLDIDVTFNADLTSNLIKQKRIFGGINATYLSPYYDVMSTEQRTSMVEELTKSTAPDAVIATWNAKPIAGIEADNFLIDVDFQSTHFLEKAGPRILFKAGELIGPQTEMYRDDNRETEIENDFNRGYNRIIKIHIPSGYQVKNAKDLKIDVTYADKDSMPFLFQSDYAVNGDVLEITIKEYYKKIYAPLARYEDFRKVINAAADFNKVTLVFEKK